MKYLNLFCHSTHPIENKFAFKMRWLLLGFVLWLALESIDFRLFLLMASEANNTYTKTPNTVLLNSFEEPTQCLILVASRKGKK